MTEDRLQKEYFKKIVCSPYSCYYVLLIYIHLFIVLGTITYPLIVRGTDYDSYYLIFLYLLILQWIFLKNECVINYIEKKKNRP